MWTPFATAQDVFIAGVMEHIEEAGVHSGDSACSLPPHSLWPETLAELERQTADIARALNVVGLMNVQYAIKGKDVYVLEVNPRASRTVPFVAKVIGHPVASIAARVMAGEKLASFNLTRPKPKHVGVKEAVFPFERFPEIDPVLGPGDALHRRGDGHRPQLRFRLREEPACGWQPAAGIGDLVRFGERSRQGPDRRARAGTRGLRFQDTCDTRHRPLP